MQAFDRDQQLSRPFSELNLLSVLVFRASIWPLWRICVCVVVGWCAVSVCAVYINVDVGRGSSTVVCGVGVADDEARGR